MQLWLTEMVSFELVCLHTVFMSHMFCCPLVNHSHNQTACNQFYTALPVNNICSIRLMSTIPFIYLFIYFPAAITTEMVVVITFEDTLLIRAYWLHMKLHANCYIKHSAYTLNTKNNAVKLTLHSPFLGEPVRN